MWKRNTDRLPLVPTLTGSQTHNPGMCHDWESNLQPFALQDIAQLSHIFLKVKVGSWLFSSFTSEKTWPGDLKSPVQVRKSLLAWNLCPQTLSWKLYLSSAQHSCLCRDCLSLLHMIILGVPQAQMFLRWPQEWGGAPVKVSHPPIIVIVNKAVKLKILIPWDHMISLNWTWHKHRLIRFSCFVLVPTLCSCSSCKF